MFKLSRFFGKARKTSLISTEREAIWQAIQARAPKIVVRESLNDCHISHMDPESVLQATKNQFLTPSEKADGLKVLRAYMEKNPVQEPFTAGVFFTFFTFHRFVAGTLAVVLLVGAGGTASFAAEDSLPGEFLYTVKIHVNEPLREVLTRDPKARVAVQIQHMERRFTEAEELARAAKLNAEVAARLEARIHSSMEDIEVRITKLSEDTDDVEDISDQYEFVLEAQETALASLWDDDEDEDDDDQDEDNDEDNEDEDDNDKEKDMAMLTVTHDYDLSGLLEHVKHARSRFHSSRKFAKEIIDEVYADLEDDEDWEPATGTTVHTSIQSEDGNVSITTSTSAKVHIETDADADVSITTSSSRSKNTDSRDKDDKDEEKNAEDHDEDDEDREKEKDRDQDDDEESSNEGEEDFDISELEDFIDSQINGDGDEFDIDALEQELLDAENEINIHSESRVKSSVKVNSHSN